MFVYPFCFPLSAGFNPRTHTGCGHVHLLHVASIFCFNPRTTQGSTFWAVPCIVIMLVSIHAPTQGATSLHLSHHSEFMRFNPRTHTGCDLHWYEAEYVGYVFQSTHPHGVRHICSKARGLNTVFQSTHPHGVRLLKTDNHHLQDVFQSTHPHGVRPFVPFGFCVQNRFQSTHPHGVRRQVL